MSRARETAWVLGMNGVQIVATALSFIRLARELGPADYGKLSFALAVASFFPLMSGLGADHVLIMQASRAETTINELFGNALVLRLGASIAIMACAVVAALRMSPPMGAVLILISASSLVTGMAQPLFASYYRVIGRPRFVWAALAVGQVLFCTLLFVPSLNVTLLNASWAYFTTSLAVVVLVAVDIRQRITLRFDGSLLRRNMGLGLLFSGSQIVDLAFQRVDIILLQFLAGEAAVGTYSAGYKFVGVLLVIPAALHIVYLPEFHRIAGANPLGDDLLQSAFLRMRRALIEICAVLLGAVAVNSTRLVAVFLNAKYAAAANVVAILAFATLVTFATYPYSMLAEAMGKVALRLWLRCVATVVVSVAVGLLIVAGGTAGAAIGVTIGSVVFLGLLHWCTRPVNGGVVELARDCRPLVAAIIAGAIVSETQAVYGVGLIGLLLSSVAFGVLFVTSGSVLRVLRLLDIRTLYRTARI